MAKAEWGTKRVCLNCSARFYDMLRDPIVCPSCGTTFDPTATLKTRRSRPAAKPVVAEKVVAKHVAVVDDDDDLDIDPDDDAAVDDDDEDEDEVAAEEASADADGDEDDDEGESAIEDVSELGDDDVSDVIDADVEDENGTH